MKRRTAALFHLDVLIILSGRRLNLVPQFAVSPKRPTLDPHRGLVERLVAYWLCPLLCVARKFQYFFQKLCKVFIVQFAFCLE
ncbi:MAG: hypothetical protein RLO15_17855, partial [Parvibaculum sp.]